MSRSSIAEDYERQLIRHLQEDLNRRLRLIDGIIDRPEMAMMMFNIASSMMLGAQVFAATNARPETNIPALLDELSANFAATVARNRERVLRTAAAIQRGDRLEEAF